MFHGQEGFLRELVINYLAFTTDLCVRLLPAACVYSDTAAEASYADCLAAVKGAHCGAYVLVVSAAVGLSLACRWSRQLPPPAALCDRPSALPPAGVAGGAAATGASAAGCWLLLGVLVGTESS